MGIFLAVRESVHAAIDQDLRVRLEGIQRSMERTPSAFSEEDLRYEIREHSGVRPGGDMLQVSDAQGNWIFRSASIRSYDIPQPLEDLTAPRYETRVFNNALLRIVSAKAGVPRKTYTVQLASPLGQVFNALERLQWFLLLSIPVVLILATIGGYWMSRKALAPVDAITSTARSISEHSLSKRLPSFQTGDELQRLAESFNRMMDR